MAIASRDSDIRIYKQSLSRHCHFVDHRQMVSPVVIDVAALPLKQSKIRRKRISRKRSHQKKPSARQRRTLRVTQRRAEHSKPTVDSQDDEANEMVLEQPVPTELIQIRVRFRGKEHQFPFSSNIDKPFELMRLLAKGYKVDLFKTSLVMYNSMILVRPDDHLADVHWEQGDVFEVVEQPTKTPFVPKPFWLMKVRVKSRWTRQVDVVLVERDGDVLALVSAFVKTVQRLYDEKLSLFQVRIVLDKVNLNPFDKLETVGIGDDCLVVAEVREEKKKEWDLTENRTETESIVEK